MIKAETTNDHNLGWASQQWSERLIKTNKENKLIKVDTKTLTLITENIALRPHKIL